MIDTHSMKFLLLNLQIINLDLHDTGLLVRNEDAILFLRLPTYIERKLWENRYEH